MRTRSSKSHSSAKRKKEKAYWSLEDEAKLLAFLMEHRASMSNNQMFKGAIFNKAAMELNKSLVKGAAKTEAGVKAKWGKIKKTYNEIVNLKSKSGIRFMWDDNNGMGVTPERHPEWEDLRKGKSSLLRFANEGWPHFTVMQSLIHATTKGTHTYQGMQLGTQTPAPEPIGSTPSSSKRGYSSLDDAVSSSSTSSRITPSEATAIYGLQTTLESFATTVLGAFTQPLPERVPPQSNALKRLFESVESSASSEGGAWLSPPEVNEMLVLFHDDSVASSMYLAFPKTQEGENLSREWLRGLLHARMARASSPGGSEAP